jgi:L-methionine (R)-S-oxide reductase
MNSINFHDVANQNDLYNLLLNQLESVLEGERNPIANTANFAALLFQSLENINWCGFYFLSGKDLVLATFQGKIACMRIPLGKGVCGTAAINRRTERVADVHLFPGHIACDSASESEIVIPIIVNQELIGVLDIDSPIKNRFSENDQIQVEKLLDKLIELSDFDLVKKIY